LIGSVFSFSDDKEEAKDEIKKTRNSNRHSKGTGTPQTLTGCGYSVIGSEDISYNLSEDEEELN
jgi:hypothetical protein